MIKSTMTGKEYFSDAIKFAKTVMLDVDVTRRAAKWLTTNIELCRYLKPAYYFLLMELYNEF